MSFAICVAAFTAALVGVGCGGSDAREPSNVVAADAWAPATGESRGFVFVTLTADRDDELIAAKVPPTVARLSSVFSGLDAESVGGHLGHLDGDGAPAHSHGDPTRIALTKEQPVALRPGEGRIILDELLHPLTEGATFVVTLTFASGAEIDTTVTVRASLEGGS